MTFHGWVLDHLDIALVLAVVGLVVHWIRRVNRSFEDLEKLRYDTGLRLAALEAALHEHVRLSDQVWDEVGRRLGALERPAVLDS
jgi:hypothetical protein